MPLIAVVDAVLAPWRNLSGLRFLVRQHGRRLLSLEEQMTAFEDQMSRGAQIVGLLRAEFASLRQQVADLSGQVAAEEADDQAQVAAGVDAARQADADRVGSLIDQLAEVLPAEVPQVPTPEPGEPATDPSTGESSDDVVGGGGTPDTTDTTGGAPADEGTTPAF